MRELKLEDCKVGMTLKLKEDCPFRKYWKIDPKEPVKCIVLEVVGSRIDSIFVDIYYKNGRKCVPRNWYFYTEDSIIINANIRMYRNDHLKMYKITL